MKLKFFKTRINLLTLFLVSLSATVFRIVLQAFIPPTAEISLPRSMIVEAGVLIPSFIAYALIVYFFLSIGFAIVQEGLQGNKIKKGLTFGFLFSVMWGIYLLEPLPTLFTNKLTEMLAYPIVDGLSLMFLGLLLGVFVGKDSQNLKNMDFNLGKRRLAIVTFCFVLLRLFSYNVIHITSSFFTSPLKTIIWTIISGSWIGIMYSILKRGIGVKSDLKKALTFGFFIYGANLLLFNFFIVLVYKVNIIDLIARTMTDITSITIGTYINEKIIQKQKRYI
ncbi:hypothetical protein Calhy_2392 [Caldicellulosiruptor hydrothermalis 108]|uniref:Uncharacterized protein n=1 Tax=Caldicellulosiruptor hydrothermalis (strain DSM 18901 / VKM B-2411 / 108) TaxID=632292 RepID=E4Q942_CALH1|nr:hypothetical protein [Caldicellulosiruptor hydrothermalis]ADQ08091.1 hypothetical protein Calhy_2392 [Caldicellulosiruptor hydrothermalis 108]